MDKAIGVNVNSLTYLIAVLNILLHSIFSKSTWLYYMGKNILQIQPETNVKYLFIAALKLKRNERMVKLTGLNQNWATFVKFKGKSSPG